MSIKLFRIVYFVGIGISIILAIASVQDKYFITIVGVGHVLILSFFGWQMKKPADKLGAGLRVQTAGYLHTLIGFTGALFQLDQNDLLNSIISPLSYALLTSLFGWLFGGELVNDSQEDEAVGIEKEAKRISRELRSFADEIAVMHRTYLERIENASLSFETHLNKVGSAYERMLDTYSETINRLNTKQTELIEELKTNQKRFIKSQNDCYNSMNDAMEKSVKLSYDLHDSIENFIKTLATSELSSIADNVKLLKEQTNLAAESMKETANSSSEVAKYLRDSRVLIDELEKVLESVTDYRRERL